ncbi:hypothetical protein [Niallia nealsonii]|uniref:Uncharacterized protein n=1 Tax=Niallia nealsonii TaxID=115979 RepID=A0A2N0Z281_9BACI|nr:hypothetical protein [Niallia nealsonii]PKG23616.1 hypothetical protein CWS01_11545 [Niallia nealsonii]
MRLIDERERKDFAIKLRDLVVCKKNNYMIIRDMPKLKGMKEDREFSIHLLNITTFELIDSYCNLGDASNFIQGFDEVLEVIPSYKLSIVASDTLG